jgi:hypothetical protein
LALLSKGWTDGLRARPRGDSWRDAAKGAAEQGAGGGDRRIHEAEAREAERLPESRQEHGESLEGEGVVYAVPRHGGVE